MSESPDKAVSKTEQHPVIFLDIDGVVNCCKCDRELFAQSGSDPYSVYDSPELMGTYDAIRSDRHIDTNDYVDGRTSIFAEPFGLCDADVERAVEILTEKRQTLDGMMAKAQKTAREYNGKNGRSRQKAGTRLISDPYRPERVIGTSLSSSGSPFRSILVPSVLYFICFFCDAVHNAQVVCIKESIVVVIKRNGGPQLTCSFVRVFSPIQVCPSSDRFPCGYQLALLFDSGDLFADAGYEWNIVHRVAPPFAIPTSG